jgi:hypothetical protein
MVLKRRSYTVTHGSAEMHIKYEPNDFHPSLVR